LIENILGLKEILPAAEAKEATRTQMGIVRDISKHVNVMKDSIDAMHKEMEKAHKLDLEKCADLFCSKVKPLMDKIRDNADALELMVDDEMWPLPKMRELLWTR
jgi:glutamine synthetase